MQHFSKLKINPNDLARYPPNKRKKVEYNCECDDIFSFDIEVSSAWVDSAGNLVGYEKGVSEKTYNNMMPLSLCYIWQFGYNNEVYYGRDLRDFLKVLDMFPKDTHIIIWIHNASYELQFLLNILYPFSEVFARDAHKPIKFVSELYPFIEFRCSYMLTRLSLDSWGKELGFPKLHSLDYTILRTPKTILWDYELEYCETDILVMYWGLRKYREKYVHIENIPLTQTGEVRREVKKRMRTNTQTGKKDGNICKRYVNMLPKNAYEYAFAKKVFRGGDTHANFLYAGETIRGVIKQKDFASSYPYTLIAEKFPMSAFIPDVYNETLIQDYAYLLKIHFTNLTAKTFNHYIPKSKCVDIINGAYDNGRIINADSLTTWITEIDFEIIKKTYNFEFEIEQCFSARKGYLPTQFVNYIVELYCQKTELKGIEGKEDIYMNAKQKINSLYGMCVTDLIQDDVELLEGGEWHKLERLVQDVEEKLQDLLHNNKGRTFLSYYWGVYCTAWARYHLWQLIIPNDDKVIYYDTDSVKTTEEIDVSWYNKEVAEKLKRACKYHKIDFEKIQPKDKKGIPHMIGLAEDEPDATEFKTLGAKRYVYRSVKDGELHLTVAGINKEAVKVLNDNIENFTELTVFDKDADGVKKLYHTYINEQPTIIWNKGKYDEFESDYKYGINMRPTSYSMGVVDEYLRLIQLSELDKLKCLQGVEV